MGDLHGWMEKCGWDPSEPADLNLYCKRMTLRGAEAKSHGRGELGTELCQQPGPR